MARSRNIKPGFFLNEDLAECDPLARILFCGLWCLADCEGRLEDRPKRIKASVLPYDETDTDALLDQLQQAHCVERYEVEGQRYIWVSGFAKHQNPHKRERDNGSEIPPFPGQGRDKAGTRPGLGRNKAGPGTEPARLIPDSLNLIPDIPLSDSTESEIIQEDEKPTNGKAKKRPTKPKPKSFYELSFDQFWEAWPKERRVEKADALKEWLKLKPDAIMAAQIIAKVNALKDTPAWADPKFIMHPHRWLKKRRWEDAVVTAQQEVDAARAPLKQRIANWLHGRENSSRHMAIQSVGTDEEIWAYERDYYDDRGVCPDMTGRWHKDQPPAKWIKDRRQTEETRP